MKFFFPLAAKLGLCFLSCLLWTYTVAAQETESIALELNKLEPTANDCVLTFVASSKSSKSIDKLAYEFVVFDNEFRVQRMTVFDFRDLGAGKIRVRQFQLPETKCDGLGRLLINDVSACEGRSLDPSLCVQGLQLSNKTNIEFLN